MTGPGPAAPGGGNLPPVTDDHGQTPTVDLAAALSQMAGLVLSRETVDTALHLVTTLAADTAGGTMGAAVTVVDEHGKRSRAASDPTVEQADGLQLLAEVIDHPTSGTVP